MKKEKCDIDEIEMAKSKDAEEDLEMEEQCTVKPQGVDEIKKEFLRFQWEVKEMLMKGKDSEYESLKKKYMKKCEEHKILVDKYLMQEKMMRSRDKEIRDLSVKIEKLKQNARRKSPGEYIDSDDQ